MVDPGFGFGKALGHNLALLRELSAFSELGVPVLAGLSRKSMLGAITGQDVEHRLPASLAAALIAVQRGRCHRARARRARHGGCAEGVAGGERKPFTTETQRHRERLNHDQTVRTWERPMAGTEYV